MKLGDPADVKGGASWILLGAGAALVALVVASFFPSVIPVKAKNVRL